jgi:pyruvate/2-oxoglutarate dehydrogenase complex dihydrolipoamide dehydrogenase (E3) component
MDALAADAVLVAVGRAPNVEGLGLAAAGVATGQRGVAVDARLRTTAPHVWACGDVTGPPYWTHAAEDQARTVAANALGGRRTWSGRAVPWVTYTDPEVAGVGLTEAAARERYGDDLEVLRLPYHAIDRAVTEAADGAAEGLVKVLLAPGWTRGLIGGEVVGAHVVGARAGELIAPFALLVSWRLPAGVLAKAVQAYPTFALGARQAVGLHWSKTDGPRPSRLERLARRLAG